MILQAASDNHRKPLLSLGYSPGLIVCVCKLIQGLSKDLESLRAWATLVKGCWHCTDFFQYPSACRSLLMSVGAGTDQCFTKSDCFGKCHSVVRLGSRVSHAVRCLSLTRQPCLGPCSSMAVGSPPLVTWVTCSETWYRVTVTQQSCLPRTAEHLNKGWSVFWI